MMTKEYTYQDLFEGEKFGLDSALRDGADYEAFRGLRMLLMLSHNQINKLEARIAELERIHSFSDNISAANDLFKRAAKADRDLRYANAKATVNKILGKEEPISVTIDNIDCAVGSMIAAVGYVPDDLHQP